LSDISSSNYEITTFEKSR